MGEFVRLVDVQVEEEHTDEIAPHDQDLHLTAQDTSSRPLLKGSREAAVPPLRLSSETLRAKPAIPMRRRVLMDSDDEDDDVKIGHHRHAAGSGNDVPSDIPLPGKPQKAKVSPHHSAIPCLMS